MFVTRLECSLTGETYPHRELLKRYGSTTTPESIATDIEELLPS